MSASQWLFCAINSLNLLNDLKEKQQIDMSEAEIMTISKFSIHFYGLIQLYLYIHLRLFLGSKQKTTSNLYFGTTLAATLWRSIRKSFCLLF